MRIFLTLVCFCLVFVISGACKFNPNLQGDGVGYLQGIWKEDSVAYQDRLLQYTRHSFKFDCDSVYITFTTHSKTNIYPDSCYNNGIWKEYAKGSYLVRNDTLYINSTFTKSNFKQKLSGCYRIGQYLSAFVIKKHSQNQLIFESTLQHLPLSLKLVQKTDCTPKPLN